MMDVKDALMLHEEYNHNHESEAITTNPVDHQHGLSNNEILNI